ncbi:MULTISPECIES: glycerophosphodiester phosphodiesterase [Cytobacillus]|uniref:glycerophosphodiester phosphodiesterase n=1 Tax=Cytobacillus TaxID=2675230 RepID=UPI002041AF78|nr:glycerophosphodiester phosphodiesterase [Cytobacillus firmus]MCM3706949.1 glycerophosphodiester phosphodiesterase [Cytobacillus firmus]
MRKPLITAHTGCMNTRPNSVLSVLEGIKAGAEIIEADVNSTKDGIPVLVHDEFIPGISGNVRIGAITFDELKAIDKKGEIVRLEEILPLIREHHKIINLDVKTDHAVDAMIAVIEKHRMRDEVIISGCEKERATYIKGYYPSYQVLLNSSAQLFISNQNDYEAFVKQTCQDAIGASCCGININYKFCSNMLVEVASLRCLPVLVWTIDDIPAMDQFLRSGVHSITTNEVEALVNLRGEIR